MKPPPIHVAAIAALSLLGRATPSESIADGTCTDEGSRFVAASWSDGPPLHCPPGTRAARWRVWTPPHRMLVPDAGHTLVEVRQRPRLYVSYTCTDSWLRPVRIASVRAYGYVFDVVTRPCRNPGGVGLSFRTAARSRTAHEHTVPGRASPPAATATSTAVLSARKEESR